MEYVTPEGLRIDGRRPKELRRLDCSLDVLQSADGSAVFQMGNTKVGDEAMEGTGAEARVMYDNQAQLNWGQETRKANLYESHVSQVPFSPQHFLARKPGGKT
eukprot:1159689-Pelagomonas_calceolata.AAC.2